MWGFLNSWYSCLRTYNGITVSYDRTARTQKPEYSRTERIFVLPNLFDIKSIQTEAEGNIEPSVLSFINPYTTIAVGRLENQKNYSELLEIFFLVNKDFPLARLIVPGSGKLKRKLLYQTKKL